MKTTTVFWVFLLAVKILAGGLLPLSPDESYYWAWGKIGSLSYFDHPPFVSYLFGLGESIFPGSSFSRIPGILLGHLSILVWMHILKPHLEPRSLLLLMILFTLNPLLGPGSIVITPDIPLVFFWSVATLALIRIVENKGFLWAAIFGASLGLGFLGKYHMALFSLVAIPSVFIYRTNIDRFFSKVIFTCLFFVIFSSPVFIWNLQNDFISFRFQLSHGFVQKINPASEFFNYALGMILLISPVLGMHIIKNLKSFSSSKDLLILKLSATIPFVFFALTSLKGHVELNWPIIGFAPGIGLFLIQATRKEINRLAVWWVLISILAIGFLAQQGQISWNRWMTDLPQKYEPLFGGSYQTASQAWFASKVPVYKLRGSSRFDHFDLVAESEVTKSEFFVLLGPSDSLADESTERFKFDLIDNPYPGYKLLKGSQK